MDDVFKQAVEFRVICDAIEPLQLLNTDVDDECEQTDTGCGDAAWPAQLLLLLLLLLLPLVHELDLLPDRFLITKSLSVLLLWELCFTAGVLLFRTVILCKHFFSLIGSVADTMLLVWLMFILPCSALYPTFPTSRGIPLPLTK